MSFVKGRGALVWFVVRLKQNWLRVAGMVLLTLLTFRLPDSFWLKCAAVFLLVYAALAKPGNGSADRELLP